MSPGLDYQLTGIYAAKRASKVIGHGGVSLLHDNLIV